jgi:hypothetical protein
MEAALHCIGDAIAVVLWQLRPPQLVRRLQHLQPRLLTEAAVESLELRESTQLLHLRI